MMNFLDRGPAHVRYCQQLVAARSDDVIIGLIERGAMLPEWWPRCRPLRRTYGRFFPEAERYLSITLETIGGPQVVANVEAFADAPPDGGWVIGAEPFGYLRLSLAIDNLKLPALVGLMGRPGSRMVRYRPGQRCVVRVDDGDRTMWAKTFADDRGEIIHHNDLLVWERRHELAFTVAPPGRYDAATRTMWNDHVPGAPVKAVLKGADGSVMSARMGRAFGTIPASSIVPALTNEPRAELERTMIRAAHLATVVPALAGPLDELMGLLEPAFTATAGRPLRAVHGAPHHEQWLTTGVDVGSRATSTHASGHRLSVAMTMPWASMISATADAEGSLKPEAAMCRPASVSSIVRSTASMGSPGWPSMSGGANRSRSLPPSARPSPAEATTMVASVDVNLRIIGCTSSGGETTL